MTKDEIGREAPEMVERVAEAIRSALSAHGDHVYAQPHHKATRLTQIDGDFDLLVVARAAIEALRLTYQPGDAMQIIVAKRAWNAGIDAALSDSRTGAEQTEGRS